MPIDPSKMKIYDTEALHRDLIDRSTKEAESKREETVTADKLDKARRMGRVMRAKDFITKIMLLAPTVKFQLSHGDPSKYGIYRPRREGDPVGHFIDGGLYVFVTGMESGLLNGGLDEGIMPEFSYFEADDEIIPDGDAIRKTKKFKREIRGWRTVLAALFTEGLLTEAQIEKNFAIGQGQASEAWHNKFHPAIDIN